MISIEPIAENNPAPAFAIYKQAMRESTEAARGEPWTEDREYHQFCNQWQIETSHWIMHNQQRVGFLDLRTENNRLFIYNIAIHPNHQKKGIGSKVLNQLKQQAQQQNLKLELGVPKVNTRARTLYERHGFRAVGQKKHHVQMRWMESK